VTTAPGDLELLGVLNFLVVDLSETLSGLVNVDFMPSFLNVGVFGSSSLLLNFVLRSIMIRPVLFDFTLTLLLVGENDFVVGEAQLVKSSLLVVFLFLASSICLLSEDSDTEDLLSVEEFVLKLL
jgi:hypothetical protein